MRAGSARPKPAIQEPRSLSSVLLPFTKTPASMAERGAALQTHNNELVSCIEDLREKRDEVQRQIREDETQRDRVQKDLASLTKQLSQVNDSLTRKMATRAEYDKVIEETEAAFLKILDSSHTLLEVLKRESLNMQKKRSMLTSSAIG